MEDVGGQLEHQRPFYAGESEHAERSAIQPRHQHQLGRRSGERRLSREAFEQCDARTREHADGNRRVKTCEAGDHEGAQSPTGPNGAFVAAAHHETGEHEEEVDREIPAWQNRTAGRGRPKVMYEDQRRRDAPQAVQGDHAAWSGVRHPASLPRGGDNRVNVQR